MTTNDREHLHRIIGDHMNAILAEINDRCGSDQAERKAWYDEVQGWITGTIKNTFEDK